MGCGPASIPVLDAAGELRLEDNDAPMIVHASEGAAAGRAAPGHPAYPSAAGTPTQIGAGSIRYDFNEGARIVLPARDAGRWRVRLRDLDTGNILFESENRGALVRSSKRYYIRFGIEVWDVSDVGAATLVLAHEYDAYGQDVLIHFPIGTLGDTLAWLSYAARFWQVNGCRLTCTLSPLLIPLLRDGYPNIRFVTPEIVGEQKLADRAYATYCLGLFFDDNDCVFQPTDFRQVGLHRTAAYILGVDPAEEAPTLVLPDESRPIEQPYVCIAVQSSTQSKYWNNPDGWRGVIAFLKQRGYRVICIDQRPVSGRGLIWTHIPHGAEDETGDRPLTERGRWLRHAAAFIGLSSGLAWLAWAARTPVVMISGFTHPTNEFATPYRIINWHTCNSCWNDVRHRFNHDDFLYCPRQAGTPRQFECSRLITVAHVVSMLQRLPTLPVTPFAAKELLS